MGARDHRYNGRHTEMAGAQPETALLRTLGERVREARARRGMTRRILARDSGVSERHLAQLETGQANVSVLLLAQISAALGLSAADLLRRSGDEEPAELTLIHQFLRRLPERRLARVRAQLLRDFGEVGGQRENRIALIGLRGAGKSTLGAALAAELHVPFVELDREVEREAGTGLSEIFLLYGQQGFRRYERRCLEKTLETHERCVIATGGSIVSEPATYDLLLSTCFTVWLKASPEEHMERVIEQGDTRPMAGNAGAMDDLRRILDSRAALYGQADATVDTSARSPRQCLKDLKRTLAAAIKERRT